MSKPEYGTAEYYKGQFMDFMGDAQADEPRYGDALVEGFILALRDWRDYHKAQVDEYNRVEQRVREASSV